MKAHSVRGMVLVAAFIALPTVAQESEQKHADSVQLPGPMEYLEVWGEQEQTSAQSEHKRQRRFMIQQLNSEQHHSLQGRQQAAMERFRAEREKALAEQLRQESEQEAARTEEQRRQLEEERKANDQQAQEPT
ncbi:hypothetical protein [Microbulbifer aggregans]|uniref:hypothetical protein n=1 Tax=Microbulbifer aggregans TaxID=1769779 RepID=UPI001CFCE10C|nr:hypothetical protein [Microbulbifer aggregans]